MSKVKVAVLVLILLGVVLATIILGAALVWMSSSEKVSYDKTVLEIDLPSSVAELPRDKALSLFLQSHSSSIWEFRKALSSAAVDDKILALYIKVPYLSMSWAQIEEIRNEIRNFSSSGKPVHMFLNLDIATEKEIFLASAADTVYLNPTANLLLDGFMAETVFLKGTMEKLGITPEFIQFKEYKSAETYSRDSMTPEIRSMYRELLTDMQEHFLQTVSEARGLKREILESYLNKGIISGRDALALDLIDETGYAPRVFEKLHESFEIPPERGFISLNQYLLSSDSISPGRSRARIAVVGAEGMIITGRSQAMTDMLGSTSITGTLSNLRRNDLIDGVILRVNSPGGSAVASDMIWREVINLENAGKPVVVSMSGVAGSGGYYISMGARRIICHPTTITGSIGVIFGKFDISGLMEKLGMKVDRVKISPNAGFFSLYSSLSEEQRTLIEEMIAETYQDFVSKAASGRGISFEEFEPKAHGRIYTGKQALQAGLVDELGGFADAVDAMREELGLEADDKVMLEIHPRPKTLWESLSSGDFFSIITGWRNSPLDTLLERFEFAKTPAEWLLMPEVRIH